ncbi:MAG: FeoA domain-containing protein [Candidatus Nezhaarchaeales archaeon]
MRKEVVELLELVKELGPSFNLKEAARRLNVGDELVEEALREALSQGFVEKVEGGIKLTEKGLREVASHREDYVHGRLHVLPTFLRRVFEGKIADWRSHWHQAHQVDGEGLEALRRSLRNMDFRVEDTVPLTALRENDKGMVVLLVGGRGLTRRLAEMGLTPGVEVKVARRGAFRGPIEVEVRGTKLALGYGVAQRVFVKWAR